MTDRPTGPLTTVTVLRSWPAANSDGRTALVLETREMGAIAFALNPEGIAALRSALSKAEELLSRQSGRA